MESPYRYRTIWLSDFHLGTRECKAEFLLDFLRRTESDYLFLVGDIFDGWALRRSWYWPQLHNDVVQKLLRKARKGTQVTYIPGNHDEFARHFLHLKFGDIVVKPRAVHTTADGRQLLVLHGDEFDGVIRHARWLSLLGAWAYLVILKLNRWFNHARRRLNLPYWSLAAYLKLKAKRAVQFVARFERVVAEEAARWDVDGVVCGHIHHAEQRRIGPVLYANCGDWVESCTALVEHLDGRLEIIPWALVGYPPRRRPPGGDGFVEDESHLTLHPHPAEPRPHPA
ncbi:MAG: UDP-2,3-diacylglucosamine hydrolase [Rhodothermaceae bacterium]|nr:MAG: UDP-2,3-diacylglucosamine hydrolase [Rhodothermaceae bacterium]